MKKINLLSAALLAFSFCANAQQTGNERSTGEYDKVSVSGSYTVILVPGKEGAISLSGDAEKIARTIVETDGNVLKIRSERKNEKGWRNGSVTVTVPIESIQGVVLAGSGSISSKETIHAKNFEAVVSGSGSISLQVETEQMEARMSGSGNIELNGTAAKFISSLSGSGDMDAFGFKSMVTDARLSGSGNLRVTSSDELVARISGSGNIFYKGDPKKQDTKVAGSGRISKS